MSKEERKLKVYSKSQSCQKGYSTKYKEVPAIILFGEWLAKYGFNISDHINVKVSDGQIVITEE